MYCLVLQRMYQSGVHNIEELLDIWHGLQQSAVYSTIKKWQELLHLFCR